MAKERDRHRQFTRRALVLGGGQLALFSLLAGRLYQLQVIEAERYHTLAEDNRVNLQVLAPPRGRIFDRRGRLLAYNELSYRLTLVPEQAGDVDAVLSTLAELVSLSDGDRRRVLREAKRNRAFVPVAVRTELTWEEVARVEVHTLDLPGVSVEQGQTRHYPHGPLLAHVLGYVAPVPEGETGGDPLLALPGFRVGRAGLERVYDDAMRGAAGSSFVEVNAYGRIIRELERRPGRPGADLHLTLDLDLQQLADARLTGQSGAVVCMDVTTGDVLALASTPGFDPNPFDDGLSVKLWTALVQDPLAPLRNKAVSGQYAPGSTFKPLVALAGLGRGVISPSTRVFCSGALSIGDATFHCWRKGGHGSVDLQEAMAQSCDCYFYEVARRVGVDRIAATGKLLGLGGYVGIDLPGEKAGLLPTRDWKQAAFGSGWNPGETVITGIGQGYVLATPLQLAVMTARIVNGGKAVFPRLVAQDLGPRHIHRRPPQDDLGFQPEHLRIVQRGMIGVVNGARGTAKASAIRLPGKEMAGKTGTSQVRRISLAERRTGVKRNSDLPWEMRDHALFIGYAPIEAPRYAVAVIVEHGGGGSAVAAPIARDVLLAVQKQDDPVTTKTADRGSDPRSGARGG